MEPATLHAGAALAQAYIRTGRYLEAERMLDEMIPRGRRIAAVGFSGAMLVSWAELLGATGRASRAVDPLSELLQLAPVGGPIQFRFWALVPASRFSTSLAGPLIDELGGHIDEPAKAAVLKEAQGFVARDLASIHDAAEMYAAMGMPYQEARCRIDAGELERARELVDRFGLGAGPVGARLRSVSGPRGSRRSGDAPARSGGGGRP